MDACVPVDSRVFMKKRALRKYLAESGLTDVVKSRWSAVHAEAWQGAGGGDSSGSRATRRSPQDGK